MMTTFEAVGIAEGFVPADSEDQVIQAWQHLVDTGMACNYKDHSVEPQSV